MEQGDSKPMKNARHGSGRSSMARRPTRGSLDINDSPLVEARNKIAPTAPSASQRLSPAPISAVQSPQTQTARTQHTLTPRLPSPTPGSNLSFKSAQSNLSAAPSFKTASSNLASSNLQKDFSYLMRPETYHPLPLLDVPLPFRTTQSDPSTPLATLVATGQFRSAAIAAAQILTNASLASDNHAAIFSALYTRLSCLTLCNHTPLAAQEIKALEDLNSSYYRDDVTGIHLVPWELRVLAVRLQGMGFDDARRGVMGYYELAREARLNLTTLKKELGDMRSKEEENETAEETKEEIKIWASRLKELGIRVASALVEMEDLEGATRHLKSLKTKADTETDEWLGMQKALLWLCLGDVDAARSCIREEGNSSTLIEGLAKMADGDYVTAAGIWERLVERGDKEMLALYKQNLGVCLLYLGDLEQARKHLEDLITSHHSFHALTFNLSTIYELCTDRSKAQKIMLAEEVTRMRREGEGPIGWEKVNADFKL